MKRRNKCGTEMFCSFNLCRWMNVSVCSTLSIEYESAKYPKRMEWKKIEWEQMKMKRGKEKRSSSQLLAFRRCFTLRNNTLLVSSQFLYFIETFFDYLSLSPLPIRLKRCIIFSMCWTAIFSQFGFFSLFFFQFSHNWRLR